MGLNYRLQCEDCNVDSVSVEFSAVDHYEVKRGTEDEHTIVAEWVPFLVAHSGHVLTFRDEFGNQSDPKKVRAGYIRGLDKKVPR